MLIHLILANVAVGGLSVAAAPAAWRCLLDLRYPTPSREETA
jgi:hypothetical protein